MEAAFAIALKRKAICIAANGPKVEGEGFQVNEAPGQKTRTGLMALPVSAA